MILDFTVATFQKEKQFYSAKVTYELLDYNTSLTCVFVYFCRICTVNIYVQNGLVSVTILENALISHETNHFCYKKGKHFDNRPESFTTFRETRLRHKEL